MIERTGCVLTDYNSTVGMAMTPEQKEVFDALVKHGIISPEYFDITKQRQKMREQAKLEKIKLLYRLAYKKYTRVQQFFV